MNEDAYNVSRYTREQWLLDQVNEQGYINVECASSFVWGIAYQMERHTLIVNIKGTNYSYYDVPFEEFVRGVNEQSKGVWYNMRIKTQAWRAHVDERLNPTDSKDT